MPTIEQIREAQAKQKKEEEREVAKLAEALVESQIGPVALGTLVLARILRLQSVDLQLTDIVLIGRLVDMALVDIPAEQAKWLRKAILIDDEDNENEQRTEAGTD